METQEGPIMTHPSRRTFLTLAAFGALDVGTVLADEAAATPPIDLCRLSCMELVELNAAFGAGTVGGVPVGFLRGTPLLVLDAKNPRRRAKLSGMVWKGKHFLPNGRMINQWAGVRAVEAAVRVEPSWFDGAPCLHLDYPPRAPVFGNTRDELRELAPGLMLGRFYQRRPCPRLQGYFALEC
jgi:hypothetical protein